MDTKRKSNGKNLICRWSLQWTRGRTSRAIFGNLSRSGIEFSCVYIPASSGAGSSFHKGRGFIDNRRFICTRNRASILCYVGSELWSACFSFVHNPSEWCCAGHLRGRPDTVTDRRSSAETINLISSLAQCLVLEGIEFKLPEETACCLTDPRDIARSPGRRCLLLDFSARTGQVPRNPTEAFGFDCCCRVRIPYKQHRVQKHQTVNRSRLLNRCSFVCYLKCGVLISTHILNSRSIRVAVQADAGVDRSQLHG